MTPEEWAKLYPEHAAAIFGVNADGSVDIPRNAPVEEAENALMSSAQKKVLNDILEVLGKPHTKADKIRASSDEELAKYFEKVMLKTQAMILSNKRCPTDGRLRGWILKAIQQPYEEETP